MRQHEEPQDLSPTGIAKLRELVDRLAVLQGAHGTPGDGDASPWAASDPLMEESLHFLYEHHLIIPFDWERWAEGQAIFHGDDPHRYAELDRLTVLKLLTVVARNDRFSPGTWASLFDHGDGQKLLQRLLDLETNPPDFA